MNSSSIFSSRVSRSSSRNRARSFTVSGGSSPACSRRDMPTQLPRGPSLIPSSFATRAIGRDVSITIFTASSLNSGEKLFFGRGNYFTFPDCPSYWMDCPEGSGHLSDESFVVRVASCFESEHGGGVGGYAVVVDCQSGRSEWPA